METIDIANLSAEERLRLLEELWDRLSATPEAVTLTNAQHEELDRRLDELDRDGPVGIPWEEVLRRIRGRIPVIVTARSEQPVLSLNRIDERESVALSLGRPRARPTEPRWK